MNTFNLEQPLDTEDYQEEGCSQQNQTSGFANQNSQEYMLESEENDNAKSNEQITKSVQDRGSPEKQEDPEDFVVYPKKPEGELENITFQGKGKFGGGSTEKKGKVQQDDSNEDSNQENDEVSRIQENAKANNQRDHQPETGRQTSELISHSEMALKKKQRLEAHTNSGELSLAIKKTQSENLNMLSYQTANFGARAYHKNENFSSVEKVEKGNMMQREDSMKDPEKMLDTLRDMHFTELALTNQNSKTTADAKTELNLQTDQFEQTWSNPVKIPKQTRIAPSGNVVPIISNEQRQQMRDAANNWKERTSTIDDIHISIQAAIDSDPDQIMREAESLLDFFVSLLSDQNFKIVLMTLSIVNLVISMPQHLSEELIDQQVDAKEQKPFGLSNQFLSRCVPRLVSKLSDSKNIIRQQALRALMGIFLIMKSKSKPKLQDAKSPVQASKGTQQQHQNNFVSLVLPYLQNSASWHIREELLNVLIICFLKSKNFYEFDAYKVFEALLQMLDDQKDRIRFTALEAIVAFVSIGNKLSAKEIIHQLADKQISELIAERLEASSDMIPYLNENGALELPYLEHIELAANQMIFGQNQRRDGLNSGPPGQIKNLSSHPLSMGKRGSSSGQKTGTAMPVCPPSANSLANAVQSVAGAKRTASANNPIQGPLPGRLGSSSNENAIHLQSPIYHVFGNQHSGVNPAYSDFMASAASYNPKAKHSTSMRNNRINNERIGSGHSMLLPQLQKKIIGKSGGIHETPGHSNQQNQNIYGQSHSPRDTMHGMSIKGPPMSENRFFSQQSEPGSSFYSSNYQRKISAQMMNNQLMSAQGNVNQNSLGHYMPGHGFNNVLSNHPIHLLSKDNQPQIEFGLGFTDIESSVGMNYLGIKHPPVQMISQYYQQSNQLSNPLSLQNQALSSQSRISSSKQNSSNVHFQQNTALGSAMSVEGQTTSSYYSRKDPGSNQFQSSSNNLNLPAEQIKLQRPNSNRAANGSNLAVQSNGEIPKSGGSIGEGSLLFTPEQRGNSSGLVQQMMGGLSGATDQQRQQKLFKIGNSGVTFYSDGSMMTATTGTTSHVANRLIHQGKQLPQQARVGQPDDLQQMQNWGSGSNTGLGTVNGHRGPIKAVRQIQVKKQDVQPVPSVADLCIDNRKPKRPLGAESYNLNESEDADLDRMTEGYSQEGSREENSSQLKREADDESNKNFAEHDSTILSKTYIARDEIEPFSSQPEKEFAKAMNNLQNNGDWHIQFDACNAIRTACKHHQHLLLQNGATLHSIVKQLSKHADSLRSALVKVALITISDMFFFLKRCMETYLDPLIKILIKKSSDANEFIMAEAEAALLSMCQNCQDQKVLLTILAQQTNSKSNQQRLSICKCCEFLVQSLGNNIMFFSNSDKLITQLAIYISDPCQEVRQVAKHSFLVLSHAVMNAKDYEKLLLRVLTESQYKKVKSYLDNEPQNYEPNSALANFVIKNSSVGAPPVSAFATNLTTNVGKDTPSSSNSVALNQKALNQMRAMGAAKGILRTGANTSKHNNGGQTCLAASMSGTGLPQSAIGENQMQAPQNAEGQNLNLNIKATAIINPKKIVRVQRNESKTDGRQAGGNNINKPTIKLKVSGVNSQLSLNSGKSSEHSKSQFAMPDQQIMSPSLAGSPFAENLRELQQKMLMGDWRSRQETADSLFMLIDSNSTKFSTPHTKLSDVADLLCKLLTDQNAKIQVSSIEKFTTLIPTIAPFIESNINLFFGALSSNLVSTNSQIRKLTDQSFSKLYENVNRQQMLGPLLNAIQFQANVRLKPQLIDHLSDYICDSCQPGVLAKQTLPVVYKLLDDSRSEMKLKSEKLLKKLHFLLGQQVIDLCPQPKLQRVCDVLYNNNGAANLNGQIKLTNPIAGGGTFGAMSAML